jgi:hypothetical protein
MVSNRIEGASARVSLHSNSSIDVGCRTEWRRKDGYASQRSLSTVRVYSADELVDVVKSVPAAINRLERFDLRVTLPELADISTVEQVLNVTVQHGSCARSMRHLARDTRSPAGSDYH